MNYDPITRPYSGDAHRATSSLRELYFVQSALSRNGEVATLRQAEEYAREQAMDGAPDPLTNYAERRG